MIPHGPSRPPLAGAGPSAGRHRAGPRQASGHAVPDAARPGRPGPLRWSCSWCRSGSSWSGRHAVLLVLAAGRGGPPAAAWMADPGRSAGSARRSRNCCCRGGLIPDPSPPPAVTVLSFNTFDGGPTSAALAELIRTERPVLVAAPEPGHSSRPGCGPARRALGYRLHLTDSAGQRPTWRTWKRGLGDGPGPGSHTETSTLSCTWR